MTMGEVMELWPTAIYRVNIYIYVYINIYIYIHLYINIYFFLSGGLTATPVISFHNVTGRVCLSVCLSPVIPLLTTHTDHKHTHTLKEGRYWAGRLNTATVEHEQPCNPCIWLFLFDHHSVHKVWFLQVFQSECIKKATGLRQQKLVIGCTGGGKSGGLRYT